MRTFNKNDLQVRTISVPCRIQWLVYVTYVKFIDCKEIKKKFTHIKLVYYMYTVHTLTYDYDDTKKKIAGLYFIAHTNNLTHRQLHTDTVVQCSTVHSILVDTMEYTYAYAYINKCART